MRRQLRSRPQLSLFTHGTEDVLHLSRHLPKGEPRRIADEYINPIVGSGEPQRPGKVTNVISPYVVSSFIVEAAHRLERPLDYFLVLLRVR